MPAKVIHNHSEIIQTANMLTVHVEILRSMLRRHVNDRFEHRVDFCDRPSESHGRRAECFSGGNHSFILCAIGNRLVDLEGAFTNAQVNFNSVERNLFTVVEHLRLDPHPASLRNCKARVVFFVCRGLRFLA